MRYRHNKIVLKKGQEAQSKVSFTMTTTSKGSNSNKNPQMQSSHTTQPAPFFTCNSCLIQFMSSDIQRYHMKSEWHRYNLHRKISHLPPVTSDEFIEKTKLAESAKQNQLDVDENGFEILKPILNSSHDKDDFRRILRQKVQASDSDHPTDRSLSPVDSVHSKISGLTIDGEFTTDYDEETGSEFGDTSESGFELTTDDDENDDEERGVNEHSDQIDSYSEVESEYEEDNVSEYVLTDCIFCDAHNKEIELNVRHMFNKHGLYIPERTYLQDLEGLLDFLNLIVVDEFHCLTCNFQGATLESIRNHIESKRHAKIPYDTAREKALFEEFYDFSPKEDASSSNSTSKSKKTVSFQTQKDEEEDDDKEKKEKDSKYRELAKQKQDRRNQALAAVPSYDRRTVNGLTSKELKETEKSMQRLEKMVEHRRFNNNRFKRDNYQKHYRDTLLGVL